MTPLDIDRLVGELGVSSSSSSHHSRPGWVQMCCPFCRDDSFHLGYERNTGRLNCYRCGRIDLKDWLEAVGGGRSFQSLLAEFCLVRLRPPAPPGKAREGLPLKSCRLPPMTAPVGPRHLSYLRLRNFGEGVAAEWGLIGTSHLGGRWQWRLIAPVTVRGRMASYQGRDVTGTPSRARWLSADPSDESIPIKETLYGLHAAPQSLPLLVVEGPANVWRMGAGAVATYGTSVTTAQRDLLRRHRAGVVVAFDPEEKAQEQAESLANQLADFVPTKILLMDDYEDIAAMPQAEADKLKKEVWP